MTEVGQSITLTDESAEAIKERWRKQRQIEMAAPDLLEALRQCQRVLHDLTRGDKSLSSLHLFTHAIEAETKARAAIARAEGGNHG